MKIKFWGCRGSMPVPDIRMMKYGGNTTSLEVDLGGELLLIDAGTGIRKLGESLTKRNINNFNLFITHSHWDHIQGFPFFMPIYSGKTKIRVIGCTNSYKQLKDILSSQMSYEFFPISFHDLKSKISFTEICSNQFSLNGCKIKTIRNNHSIFTSSLRIEQNGKSFVFMTDNELESANPLTERGRFIEFCRGADYLIHDSQFTEEEYVYRKTWGHSTFDQSIKLAKDSGVKNLGFFHHDPNRKDKELSALSRKYSALSHSNGYKFKIFTVKEMDEIKL
ncbi:MAG: MBL fold metallo-hydrolase [Elusimicrobiota bacterium]